MEKNKITRRRVLQGLLAGGVSVTGAELLYKPSAAYARAPGSSGVGNEHFPGVRRMFGRIHTAEEAASRAVVLAQIAAKQHTFGIGGILIDKSGNIIAEATNSVIRHNQIYDPTAHVERQLVDWFIDASHKHGLSTQPRDLTIVSSLDPCVMCAGAIMRSGIQAVAVAEDDEAGIHEAIKKPGMPADIQTRITEQIAIFKTYQGRQQIGRINNAILAEGGIPEDLVVAARGALLGSINRVRHIIGSVDSAELPSWRLTRNISERMTSLARQLGPSVLQIHTPINVLASSQRQALLEVLSNNQSVLVDDQGAVIIGAREIDGGAGAQTSVLELIWIYTLLREMMKKSDGIHFPHPRRCSIVKRHAPEDPYTILLELGAAGSFCEEPRIGTTLPAMGYLSSQNFDLAQRCAASLPPLYNRLGITVGLISSR